MAYQIKSPSGAEQIGYTRRDALYAACIVAENERRFSSRKAQPVAVFEDGKLIADVWADMQEDVV